MMAIPKYPQYPYPYFTTFVSPTNEIPIETTMMNAETKALRTGTFSTFLKELHIFETIHKAKDDADCT